MNTLSARDDLFSSNEDIKRVAELWVRWTGHGIERPHLHTTCTSAETIRTSAEVPYKRNKCALALMHKDGLQCPACNPAKHCAQANVACADLGNIRQVAEAPSFVLAVQNCPNDRQHHSKQASQVGLTKTP